MELHNLGEFQVEFNEGGKVVGVTSEGETAKCQKVVCDPSYLPNKVYISDHALRILPHNFTDHWLSVNLVSAFLLVLFFRALI